MEIRNCTTDDLEKIIELYDDARALQRERKMVVWPVFEPKFILTEMMQLRQWKIVVNGSIACNWAITYQDPEIWEERDQNNAIYIHRIVTNPSFRGGRFIDVIVDWAKIYARSLDKQFVRLDTLGNNKKLIAHYTSAGFAYLGMFRLSNTQSLPEHYQNEPNCCLFELAL